MKYSEKLKDPRWQKLRLKVLERDEWACLSCGDTESTLVIHYTYYQHGKDPWEYPLNSLMTLCENCHYIEREDRPPAEKSLLLALKKQQFLAKDILEIAIGFNYVKIPHAPEVTASIIKWALESPETFKNLGILYFQHLRKERESKKGSH